MNFVVMTHLLSTLVKLLSSPFKFNIAFLADFNDVCNI